MAGWLAAWRMAGWLRPRKAREAQRGPERRTVDRTSLSCAWLEAPHKQIYDQGSSPQISVCNPRGSPRGLPLEFQTEIHFKPRASPQEELRLGRLPTSRVTTREAPHKQNYDQGYPDLGLATPKSRPGYPDLGLATGISHALRWKLPTSRFTTREVPH